MAGPSKVEFPGKKKQQRMRARGTKRASAGVLKKLEKNLSELLEDPAAILPVADYVVRRMRKDPVQRSLKECAKVIVKKNDRKWLGKRMVKRGGDGVARALAGSLHATHDDERNMVAVFEHPVFGTASFVRRGVSKPTQLVSFQNHSHPSQRLLVWEEHARSGWWFFSIGGGIVCTGLEPDPPEGWLELCLKEGPIQFTLEDGVHRSAHSDDDGDYLTFEVGNDVVTLAEEDLAAVAEDGSFIQSIALRMLPPKLSSFANIDWNWRPDGWPAEKDLPASANERVDDVLEAWMDLSIPDAKLSSTLRQALCYNLDEGCVIGEQWWPIDDMDSMIETMSGSAPEKEALGLILTEALEENGLSIRGDGSFTELDEDVIRMEEKSCHANLIALWPSWGDLVLEDMYGITGEAAEEIIEKQIKKKQGFGAFLKKMEAQRIEHVLLSRFPWNDGDIEGVCGRADLLIRKARIGGVGSTISMAKKGQNSAEKALGWAWINVHERSESEGWHFDSDARDKGGDWVPAVEALWVASEDVAESGDVVAYVDAMEKLRKATGTMSELPEY
ncbi:MAG: hypothetical protein VX320_06395 [Candidatus Thermoplasmatota archaeon]|nr:hypothetical protein [Candidatus Thermoplasmatota archaeon]